MTLTYNLNEIDAAAESIVEKLHNNVVLFYGEMGAGKTTLIKALVSELGSTDTVSSPTYALVNEYVAEDCNIYHFDLYRLKKKEEALDIGFEEYLNQRDIILIEWPDKILDLIPEKVDVITLNTESNNSRTLKLSLNINLTKHKLMTTHHFL